MSDNNLYLSQVELILPTLTTAYKTEFQLLKCHLHFLVWNAK